MDQTCNEANCSHFISKRNIIFFRYRYLMAVIAGIILVIVWGIFSYYTYINSQNDIIQQHRQFCDDIKTQILQNDSLYYNEVLRIHLDEHKQAIATLLDMQYNKIQSEYSVLSLWAGVLMIVFLIFSIYSMFKVDEMQKQGRILLENMESKRDKANEISERIERDSAKKIAELDSKAKIEIEEIQRNASVKIKEIEATMNTLHSSFSETVKSKTADFEGAIDKYKKQLEDAAKANGELIAGLISVVRNSSSSSKEGLEK